MKSVISFVVCITATAITTTLIFNVTAWLAITTLIAANTLVIVAISVIIADLLSGYTTEIRATLRMLTKAMDF